MSPVGKKDSWNEWAMHVLSELKRLNDWAQALEEKAEKNTIEIVKLQMKAATFGALAGSIPATITFLFWIFSKLK